MNPRSPVGRPAAVQVQVICPASSQAAERLMIEMGNKSLAIAAVGLRLGRDR